MKLHIINQLVFPLILSLIIKKSLNYKNNYYQRYNSTGNISTFLFEAFIFIFNFYFTPSLLTSWHDRIR